MANYTAYISLNVEKETLKDLEKLVKIKKAENKEYHVSLSSVTRIALKEGLKVLMPHT